MKFSLLFVTIFIVVVLPCVTCFGWFWKKSLIRTFLCSSNMLKFLKVTSAPKPISLGCELPPKPKKRLVIPKNEEPSSDANLFS